jgi:polar amino acid transport system permease protein
MSTVANAPSPTRPGPVGTAVPDDDQLAGARLVPQRRTGRWIASAVVLAVIAFAVQSAVRNPRFQWSVIWTYLRAPDVVRGLWLTIWLTAAVMATGYLLGIAIAAMRLSGNPVLRAVAFAYVWFFRSIPPLVLILLVYEIASLYPRLSFGIPFGPEFVGTPTSRLFGALFSAYVALTLDVAAFAAEIVRGGLVSIDRGQIEAAQSLGLPARRIFRRIVLPQAMPAIVPNTGSLLIGTLKGTSLISVIAVSDLLYSVQLIYGQNYRVIPLLLVATIWYLVLVTLLSVVQYFIERHYGRGNRRTGTRSLRRLVRENLPLHPRALRAVAGRARA